MRKTNKLPRRTYKASERRASPALERRERMRIFQCYADANIDPQKLVEGMEAIHEWIKHGKRKFPKPQLVAGQGK